MGVKPLKPELENLDLFDLLSEHHHLLRGVIEKWWNNSSHIYLSNSEWYIISRIYKKQPTITYVSKNVDISRQATHKFIKQLESKGLVEVMNVKHNKKEKCLQLTSLGEECYEKYGAHKASLVKKIEDTIGEEQLTSLIEILRLDWGLKR